MADLVAKWSNILRFLGITDEDMHVLQSHRTFIEKHSEEIVVEFYEQIAKNSPLNSSAPEKMEFGVFKNSMLSYLYSLVSDKIDNKYISERQHIGMNQTRIWSRAAWFITAYPVILRSIQKRLDLRDDSAFRFFEAMNRKMYFDAAILIEHFIGETYEKYQLIAENSSDLIDIMDIQAVTQYVSPSHQRILGYSPEELVGRSAFEFIHPNDIDSVLKRFRPMMEHQGIATAECRFLRKDKTYIDLEVRAMPVFSENGRIDKIVSVARDISDRRKADELIHHMAYHDVLTGLLNRRALEERLIEALNYSEVTGKAFAVMFIDMDRFKDINDQLGHSFGDRFLQILASRLSNCIGGQDVLSRIGGDEFILLLSNVGDAKNIAQIAERVIKTVRQPLVLDGMEFFITCSIGYAIYPEDGRDIDTLLKNADVAMYRVKGDGKDAYLAYSPEMGAQIGKRFYIENDLRKALPSDEFVLYYQPIVELSTGRIVAMEALIRWIHPKHGILYPSDFISITEENGLIHPLGEWILREASRQNKQWQETEGIWFRICVNVSAKQFQETGFVEMVTRILSEEGMNPYWLQLEITETSLIQDIDDASMKIKKLKAMGVSISIDDFGTGYSSLSYLAKLPVDTLKIDQSFIRSLDTDFHSRSIATAVIALAHSLGLDVIAEGVEHHTVVELLKNHQCDKYQGYLIAKPLPSNELRDFIHQTIR